LKIKFAIPKPLKKRVAQSAFTYLISLTRPDLEKRRGTVLGDLGPKEMSPKRAGRRHQTLMLIWLHPLKRQNASSGGSCRGGSRQSQRLRNMWDVACRIKDVGVRARCLQDAPPPLKNSCDANIRCIKTLLIFSNIYYTLYITVP